MKRKNMRNLAIIVASLGILAYCTIPNLLSSVRNARQDTQGRLETVVEKSKSSVLPTPRLTNENYQKIQDIISPEYIDNIIQIESSGRADAVSYAGARGLMQLMPETWAEETRRLYGRELDFDLAFDPKISKEVGTAYLKRIEKYLSGRIDGWESMDIKQKQELMAAAYNGGMGRLVRNRGDILKMPEETRNYINKLKTLRNKN
ncbi:MAG: lytic transglycosylase domain-containing protein [Nanoarchaeota archaeon]|nr:lytic transglycosylase domain-containing protein [Nanoarchaeota archaeon]